MPADEEDCTLFKPPVIGAAAAAADIAPKLFKTDTLIFALHIALKTSDKKQNTCHG